MEDRSERLVALRKALAACETQGEESASERMSPSETALGCALKRSALHEVYARDASSGAVAAGIAMRLGGKRPLFWITTDYATLEYGGVTGSGFLEFGIDPRQLVFVRLPKGDDALRAAGDILSCAYIGAVVLEIEGKVKTLDLVTSRRISLAAADRNIPAILLRLGSPRRCRVRPRHDGLSMPPHRHHRVKKMIGDEQHSMCSSCAIGTDRPGNGEWNGMGSMDFLEAAAITNTRRILSVWLPRLPTDRLKHKKQRGAPLSEKPIVIAVKIGNAVAVYALDRRASKIGLHKGQPLANARAIVPDLDVVEASPQPMPNFWKTSPIGATVLHPSSRSIPLMDIVWM